MHGLGMWSVAFHNGVEINSKEEFLSIFKPPVFSFEISSTSPLLCSNDKGSFFSEDGWFSSLVQKIVPN